MTRPRFPTVDDYLDSLDNSKQRTLRLVIDEILSSFADLEVNIAWNVPQIHRNSQYVRGVSSAKRHLSLSPSSAGVIDQFRDRLERDDYVVRKNLFQVPDDWDVDGDLLGDLVRTRLSELD